MKKTIGIIGARGHTGAELIRLIAAHPGLDLAFVSSRELDGQRVADHVSGYAGELRYVNLDPAATGAQAVDAVVLALPNVPLCTPDCAGLCAECGGKWAELGPDHRHETIDPRWAALQGRFSQDRNNSSSEEK